MARKGNWNECEICGKINKTMGNDGGKSMSEVDILEIEIITDEQIEKLEKTKGLLTEIKQLKDEIFGKQEND